MTPSRDIARLIEIMAALRTPVTGCPWDLEQNFATIAPYTIEEAYEVADAIARGDLDDLRDELGDLLLQVVFHARWRRSRARSSSATSSRRSPRKMIRRHPHVFGDENGNLASTPVKELVGPHQGRREGRARGAPAAGGNAARRALLSGVGRPARADPRAASCSEKASTVGFDWNDPRAVLAKIREEADEIEAALDARRQAGDRGGDRRPDVRASSISPAMSTPIRKPRCAATNAKFERRFAFIERALEAQGRTLEQASLAEMDALWNAAKTAS